MSTIDTSAAHGSLALHGHVDGPPAHLLVPRVDWVTMQAPQHFAQFYEADVALLQSLSGYILAGIRAGDLVLEVATHAHHSSLAPLLRAQGLDVAAAQAAEQYVWLNTADILLRLMVAGKPSREQFAAIFEPILARAAAANQRVRVFGELVAVLWAEGQPEAALRLEALWNELLERQPFFLFCAYPLQGFSGEALAQPLADVCATHAHVIPTESYTELDASEDRLRAILLLQQKARSLEAEIAERKAAEEQLRAAKTELELQVEDLRRLHELSARLTSTLDIDSVLREILSAALAVQGTSLGLLSLCDTAGDGLRLEASSGFDQAFLKVVEWVPPGGGACGTCYQQRRRVIVEDVESDPIFAEYLEPARAAGFRACHSTPLITRSGAIIGVLSVHFREPHRPPERAIRLMDLYARMAADFIENARLHYQVQQDLEQRERLLASEQLARAEAERANRLKDQFLTVAAHELKTPLTALLGNAQAIERRAERENNLPERTRMAIGVISAQAKRLNKMIAALLDMSRLELGKLSLECAPFDLGALARRVVAEVQPNLATHTLECTVPADPLIVDGDELRLEQVLQNLIANAVKYSLNGGIVRVRVDWQGNLARVAVADQGMGIPAADLPHLFERFYRASNTDKQHISGMGIGLYVVKEIVELHGGSVEIESQVGGGSTFIVCLPLNQ